MAASSLNYDSTVTTTTIYSQHNAADASPTVLWISFSLFSNLIFPFYNDYYGMIGITSLAPPPPIHHDASPATLPLVQGWTDCLWLKHQDITTGKAVKTFNSHKIDEEMDDKGE